MQCSINGCLRVHEAKGFCNPHYKRWKRHGDALAVVRSRRRNGSGHLRSDGYIEVYVRGRLRREHLVVAERALGKPIPKGAVVHHVDGQKANNRNDNLVICPNEKYHNMLHVKLKALRECGNADWRKCGPCQTYDDPANMRSERNGATFVHRKCASDMRYRRATAKRVDI